MILAPPSGLPAPVKIVVDSDSDFRVEHGNRQILAVQTLIDESGSMNGFVQPLKAVEGWLGRAMTRMEAYGFVLKSRAICGFSKATGVRCSATPPVQRDASSDTNLDEAIDAAENADITVIVTDGVAATGASFARRCAGGVDASCVGEALGRYAVQGSGRRGVWLVPMTMPFKGRLYTERRISASSFDPSVAMKALGDDAEIGSASNIQSGELVFDYAGPRTLLVFVLSKDVTLGRAYVSAMNDTSAMEGFSSASLHSHATAEMFELFPGYVSPRRWSGLGVSDNYPNVSHDATLDESTQTVTFTCGVQDQPEGEWVAVSTLAGSSPIATVRIKSVPTMIGSLNTHGANFSATSLAADASRMMLRMSCSSGIPECGRSASVRTSALRIPPDPSKFSSISTTAPEREPHKAFGLADVVRSFYQRIGPMDALPIAEMKVCSTPR